MLTGVTGLADLRRRRRGAATDVPRADLAGLFEAHAVPERDGDRAVLGGWTAEVARRRARVEGEGDAGGLVAGRG